MFNNALYFAHGLALGPLILFKCTPGDNIFYGFFFRLHKNTKELLFLDLEGFYQEVQRDQVGVKFKSTLKAYRHNVGP